MDLLPLDDPRWKDLDHRNWSRGKRRAPNAPYVPEELAKLVENPADVERFNALWPWLCSEGTTWAAAYAVVPYVVDLAKRLPGEHRFHYLCFLGSVVGASSPERGEAFEIKPYLAASYQRALAEALPLIAETLVGRHDVVETRYLLAATAAMKGHRKLAVVLQDLDAICGDCPRCGECVYPSELQEAVR